MCKFLTDDVETESNIIVFTKRKGEWKPELWTASTYNSSRFEKMLERYKNSNRNDMEDYRIWLADEIGVERYWDDINFYDDANFIYLPLDAGWKEWKWYNMEEQIPAYEFLFPGTTQEGFNFERDVLFMLDNENLEKLEEFLYKIEEKIKTKEEEWSLCCNLKAWSVPYTIIVWGIDRYFLRIQIWGYLLLPLFECENGMDLKLNTFDFQRDFSKSNCSRIRLIKLLKIIYCIKILIKKLRYKCYHIKFLLSKLLK